MTNAGKHQRTIMKLKIILVLIALYLFSLVLTAPATLLTRFIPTNAGINIGHTSGTVWNGELSQLDYRKQPTLQKLTWQFDWLALLKLQLKADLKFNNGHRVLNGVASVSYDFSGLAVSDVKVNMQATELLPYLQLPVPVTPSGKLTLVIENGTQGVPYCEDLDGYLVWHDAVLETPMANIDLASPSVDLSCADGDLIATLTQDSEQLTTNADIVLSTGGNYELKGDIIGRETLDPNILQALSWIGPKKESGETLLNFKGRL